MAKPKRYKYVITGMSPSGEGYFKKTVYSKKQAEWYSVRGFKIKKVRMS